MSYKLKKPYTEEERLNFIVEHNHQQGLRIEETNKYMFALEVWEIIYKGRVIRDPSYDDRHFQEVKEAKINEINTKCSEKRYSQTFTVTIQEQECEFDTTEQTQTDLLSADSVTSKGLIYPNWVTNNGIIINLTAEDVITIYQTFFAMISPLYTKQLEYMQQVEECTTVEEIEAIIVDYDISST